MSAELRILRWGACALKEIEGGDFSGVLFSGSRSEPDFYAASFPLRASVQGWLRGTVCPCQGNSPNIRRVKRYGAFSKIHIEKDL